MTKALACPACFAPMSVGLYASLLCDACSLESRRENGVLVTTGDPERVILERAAIDASGEYWVCERELWHGDGETEERYCADTGFSVHADAVGAEAAASYWRERGWIAGVTGPHPTEHAAMLKGGA